MDSRLFYKKNYLGVVYKKPTMKIFYCETLKVKQPVEIEYERLNDKLLSKYNIRRKRGQSYYEYFNMGQQDFKMFFDIDLYIDLDDDVFDEDEYKDGFITIIKQLFNLEENDFVVSSDCREVKDKYKVSFHIVLQQKTNKKQVDKYLKKLTSFLKETEYTKDDNKYPFEIDTSIYSDGLQKFRTLYSKKDGDKNSLLIPDNDEDELHQHLIQVTDDLPDVDFPHMNDIIKECLKDKDIQVSYENILDEYDIINTKEFDNCKLHTIDIGFECPFAKRAHKSNHCYLVDFEDTVLLKCFDEDCKNKVKVLYKNINLNTIEFDLKTFNSISIQKDKKSNYEDKRKYFENFYKYFSDTNTYYRVKNQYNKKYDYYNTDLVEIKELGLKHLYYHEKDDEGTLKKKSFIKTYSYDNERTNLFNLIFDPNESSKNYYNFFDGFNYSKVLDVNDNITDEDISDFNFLLDFMKKNICEDNDNFYDYFISHISNILQNPTFLNHMIFLLYSSKQGTGKSSFLKFLSKVIGQKYSYFGSYEQVLEKHSTSSLGKFINIIEEVDFKKSSKFSEDMKNLSQREEGVYNGKGKVETKINTYVRYFLTSNNSNSIVINKEDRRYVIYEFNKIENEDDINRLDRIYENKKIIYLFGDYLMNYDIKLQTRNDWIKKKPMTSSYKLFIHSDSISTFFKDLYKKEDYFTDEEVIDHIKYNMKDDVIKIKCKKLYDLYVEFYLESGMKSYTKTNFYKKLTTDYKYIEKKKIKGYPRYIFNLRDINKHLDVSKQFTNNYVLI